jgi:hypothetical protein
MNRSTTNSAILLAVALATCAGCEDNRTDQPPAPSGASGVGDTDSTSTPPSTRPTPPRDPGVTTPSPSVSPSTAPDVPPTQTPPGNAERDKAITEEIRAIIRNDSRMSAIAYGIEIVTRAGVVSLAGNVPTQAEKDTIESRAREVSGVIEVVNNLEVQP